MYLEKQGNGENIEHLATGRWFYKYLPGSIKRLGLTLDDQCYSDYAALLLPRAVGYSAGLLNYFFRGQIEITAPDTGVYGLAGLTGDPVKEFTDITLFAKNISPNLEAMNNGTIKLVEGLKGKGLKGTVLLKRVKGDGSIK